MVGYFVWGLVAKLFGLCPEFLEKLALAGVKLRHVDLGEQFQRLDRTVFDGHKNLSKLQLH